MRKGIMILLSLLLVLLRSELQAVRRKQCHCGEENSRDGNQNHEQLRLVSVQYLKRFSAPLSVFPDRDKIRRHILLRFIHSVIPRSLISVIEASVPARWRETVYR